MMTDRKEQIVLIKRFWPAPLVLLALLLLVRGWGVYKEHVNESSEMDKMIRDYHAVDTAFEDMKKCKKGNAELCLKSGLYYLDGKFVSPNRKKAARFLYRACRLKNPIGCYELANFWGKGRKARKYYKKACAMDYNRACKALHDMKRKK